MQHDWRGVKLRRTYATSGHAAGQLTQAARAGGLTRQILYNSLGLPVTVKQTLAGSTWQMHYGFDSLGRIQSLTYPATSASQKLKLSYAYDHYGNLAQVKNAHTGTTYWQADTSAAIPAVNAFGTVQAWTLGNGINVQRNQDPATAAVTNITAGTPTNPASRVSLAYSYGPMGHTTGAYDVLTQAGYQLNTLSYDKLNRLTSDSIHNSAGTQPRSATYGPGGNITSRTGVGSYAYSATMPHAVTQTTLNGIATHYAYNSIGEMTSGGALTQIQWTRGGRVKQLIGSQTTQLQYGASGALIKKTVGMTTSRYFGKFFVKIGNAYRERIVANGQVIALVHVNVAGVATTDYLVHDAQGSPAAMLDTSGSLVARFAFNAWGELVNPQTGIGTDPNAASKQTLTTLGYTGHEMLWQAGLVHTYARLYNPAIGRWLSPDCTVPHPYNGQSFNRYAYVLNNPMTLWGPLGLSANKHKQGCDVADFVSPVPTSELSQETMNAVKAGFAELSTFLGGGDGGVGLIDALSHFALGLAKDTVSEDQRSIIYWQRIGPSSLTESPGSFTPSVTRYTDWGKWGAVPVMKGGNRATARQALCNYLIGHKAGVPVNGVTTPASGGGNGLAGLGNPFGHGGGGVLIPAISESGKGGMALLQGFGSMHEGFHSVRKRAGICAGKSRSPMVR